MGLDTTHDAFHGAYSAFNRFRKAVAEACGGSYPPHEDKSLDPSLWYFDVNGVGEYSNETHRGLELFFNHSDCDGEFTPEQCTLVANELDPLLPKLEAMGNGEGHLAARGGYGEVLRKFIAGCREAADANEPLEFG